VIPWYLIPGRPYPVQVYLYACELYSRDPDIGQRGAAEATRKRFKLEKFSHSTVSRASRVLEQSFKQDLGRRFGEKINLPGAESQTLVCAAAKPVAGIDAAPDALRRFPSAADTASRRKAMAVIFHGHFSSAPGAETAARQFVKDWHTKTERLLL